VLSRLKVGARVDRIPYRRNLLPPAVFSLFMTHRGRLAVWLAITLAFVWHATAGAVVATAAANPYQEIVARNAFGLQPPGVPTPDLPVVILPKLMLVGITTFDRKCALLRVRTPASSGVPATEWSCTLAEGQRSGEVEVLQIDEKAGSVKVNIGGAIMVLTFEKNGLAPKNTPLPPELPPAPARPVARFR
jgi:hypothetical protein